MSDNNEPLALQAIEARLATLPDKDLHYEVDESLMDSSHYWVGLIKSSDGNDIADITDWCHDYGRFFTNAPTDIAALLQRVRELEAELAEAKRTQVKDGGRGQLRPFPEPDREE